MDSNSVLYYSNVSVGVDSSKSRSSCLFGCMPIVFIVINYSYSIATSPIWIFLQRRYKIVDYVNVVLCNATTSYALTIGFFVTIPYYMPMIRLNNEWL